jgi:N-acetylneuraminate synthase
MIKENYIFSMKSCQTLLDIHQTVHHLKESITLQKLKKDFKCAVGYSGHEPSVSPSIVAYILGAEAIERHITLDRAMWGTDQAASLSEEGIKNITEIIEKIPKMFGNFKKEFSTEEKKIARKMRYWEKNINK